MVMRENRVCSVRKFVSSVESQKSKLERMFITEILPVKWHTATLSVGRLLRRLPLCPTPVWAQRWFNCCFPYCLRTRIVCPMTLPLYFRRTLVGFLWSRLVYENTFYTNTKMFTFYTFLFSCLILFVHSLLFLFRQCFWWFFGNRISKSDFKQEVFCY